MEFTREQFDYLGPFHQKSFAIDSSDQNYMFKLFNNLPESIQGKALTFGMDDFEFLDDVLEILCETQLDMTISEYYESDIYKEYSKSGKTIEIDFENLI